MPLQLPNVNTCYFCDLLGAEDSHWSVWAEDDLTATMLNGRQFETGQSMVVPKRHAPTIVDLRDHELGAVMAAAQRAARAMLQAFDPIGILLYQNNGVGSAQEVPHFHLHVVPRQPGSDWGLGPPHLAEQARRAADPKFDHLSDTREKRDAASILRRSNLSL